MAFSSYLIFLAGDFLKTSSAYRLRRRSLAGDGKHNIFYRRSLACGGDDVLCGLPRQQGLPHQEHEPWRRVLDHRVASHGASRCACTRHGLGLHRIREHSRVRPHVLAISVQSLLHYDDFTGWLCYELMVSFFVHPFYKRVFCVAM